MEHEAGNGLLGRFYWAVFNWLAAGLVVAGAVAWMIQPIVPAPSTVVWILVLFALICVAVLMYFLLRNPGPRCWMLYAIYLGYSAGFGAALSVLLFFCDLAFACFLAAGMFALTGTLGRLLQLRLRHPGIMAVMLAAAFAASIVAFGLTPPTYLYVLGATVTVIGFVLLLFANSERLRRMQDDHEPPVKGALRMFLDVIFIFSVLLLD